jgi:tRNA A37 threonylcarbamoyladenosine dehydratase
MDTPAHSAVAAPEAADVERRFGGLRRLYGDDGYTRLRMARVAVVGLGGVGSWVVEALARSGVAGLVLFDLDHVAESNINRQVQALGRTLGQAKTQALAERVADIHPGCEVLQVEDFVTAEHWPALLPVPVDLLVDACDQVRAKAALASWALASGVPLVCVGAAGGKRQAERVEIADLADASHDPLLASLRQRLRQSGAVPRAQAGRAARTGLRCVFSREPVAMPVAVCAPGEAPGSAAAGSDGSLNCHGYGSSVTVTATFGMVAAGEAISQLLLHGGARQARESG